MAEPRRVTIMGLGLFGGGLGATRHFAQNGCQVTVTDLRNAETLQPSLAAIADFENLRLTLGHHEMEDFLTADLVVASPAVPLDNPYLMAAAKHGVEITTEIEVFLGLIDNPILAVTGSNGKTTTAHLSADLLRRAGHEPLLVGNMGRSLLPEIETLDPAQPLVLEISSFQLERLRSTRQPFSAALVTNIVPNHLDRHRDFADYLAAKTRLLDFLSPGGNLILDANDEYSAGLAALAATKGQHVLRLNRSDTLKNVPRPQRLLGLFNHHNLSMAWALAKSYDRALPQSALAETAAQFEALPHRLQLVAEKEGIVYVNDSKATSPEATKAAMAAAPCPVHLIAGGYDKGLAVEDMFATFDLAQSLSLCGATAEKLAQAWRRARPQSTTALHVEKDLASALSWAQAQAYRGDWVLLSPGHPSFDHFTNFAERGRCFEDAVKSLLSR